MNVAFVVPCFNEQDNVQAFYDAFLREFHDMDWRLVMVDDGSSDATLSRLSLLAARDRRVAVISFSRNFGKEAAVYAGLEEAVAGKPDYIGLIDADLQQEPRTAREMFVKLVETPDADCVAAYQERRHEGPLMSYAKDSFYRIFAKASRSDNVIYGASDFRIFSLQVARAILALPEYHRFSKGIFSWVGFKTIPFPYTPADRNAGQSK